ncbi:hypothetical protein ACFLS9_06190 [Bacteroidota bacterium]
MKRIVISLIIITFLSTSYEFGISPFLSLFGSICIILLGYSFWGNSWKEWLGFNINKRDLLFSILLFPILIILVFYLIKFISLSNDIVFKSPVDKHGFFNLNYIHTVGQTLNEEIVLGALLLFSIKNKYSKLPPLVISILVAFIFSVMHYIFYAWIFIPKEAGILSITTLFCLFSIGVLRNSLILKFGHIGFAWVIHLSFNIVFLWSVYYTAGGQELNEAATFNLIFGSQIMVILSVLFLLFSVTIFWKLKWGA